MRRYVLSRCSDATCWFHAVGSFVFVENLNDDDDDDDDDILTDFYLYYVYRAVINYHFAVAIPFIN